MCGGCGAVRGQPVSWIFGGGGGRYSSTSCGEPCLGYTRDLAWT